MKLLEKIKDDYAKELHCQSWIELLMEITIKQEELDVHDEIAKRYAKAVLERAAESATLIVEDRLDKIYNGYTDFLSESGEYIKVNKQSILNTKID